MRTCLVCGKDDTETDLRHYFFHAKNEGVKLSNVSADFCEDCWDGTSEKVEADGDKWYREWLKRFYQELKESTPGRADCD